MGEGARNSFAVSSTFAFLHSSFVLALTFHRLDHSQQFAIVPQVAFVLR